MGNRPDRTLTAGDSIVSALERSCQRDAAVAQGVL